jgi:hypothetical protein
LALKSRTAGAIALASGLAVLMIGGGVSAATSPPAAPQQANSFADTDQSPDEPSASDESSPAAPSPAKPTAVVAVTTVEVEEAIPYGSVTVDDPNLAAGTTVVSTAGVAGVLVVSYRVTTTDGVETARQRLSERVATAAINQVTSRGTYVAPAAPPPAPPGAPASNGCDPNYSGCVPIASDVDCAGGSGNGPEYLSGTVTVVGTDIYDLDRDGDGTACE